MSTPLTGLEKRHLRGLAHALKPLVQVGKSGLTPAVVQAVAEALEAHELIKVRLVEAGDTKKAAAQELAEHTGSRWVGTVGHVVTLYRPQDDPEKRRIELPRQGVRRPQANEG
jgi:RNA-binding protein